jgi:hypothetical protein
MKEQAPIPPWHRVYKQGFVTDQSAGRVHNNTDDSSYNEVIPAPLLPQGVSQWGQVTGQQKLTSFSWLVTGTRQNVVPHINKDLTPCNLFIFYSAATITLLVKETSCYYQQYLTSWSWTFSCTWCHWIWNVSVYGNYYLDRTWQTWQPEILLVNY